MTTKIRVPLLLQIFILMSLFLITTQNLAHGSGSNSKLEKTDFGRVVSLDVKWVDRANYYYSFHAHGLLNAHPHHVELRASRGGGFGGGGGRSGRSGGRGSGRSGGRGTGGRSASRGRAMGFGQYGGHNGHRERASKANMPSISAHDHEGGHELKKPRSRFLGKYVKHNNNNEDDDLSPFQTTPRKLRIYVRRRGGGSGGGGGAVSGVRPIGTTTRGSSSSSVSTHYHRPGFLLSLFLSFGVVLMVL
ncbi:hypothetical protein FNV43_RR03371 [Rhamnella rubrinervis]|uniref:Glycine-rich protein n=1 Tax=Rhamnella rubrinervis TaxID=2594499 RepID=A0A8K0HJV7_9ROSA|nr:hypothetical protein FNV43_RR03371 [Rhamnella rubrinervis]